MNEIITKAAQGDVLATPVESRDVALQQGGGAPVMAQEGPGALLSAIVQLAKDPSVDVTKLEALLGMQERMEARQAERLFNEALTRIQAKAPRIPKNGVVLLGERKGSYDFAKWEDMDALIGPLLREEGFSVTFSEAGVSEQGIRWSATWRAFGHAEINYITLPPDSGAGRNALQARGSTNSYAKRYLTEDFLKLVREGADDDGKRGGTKFITDEQAGELRAWIKDAGRQEGPLLDQMFGGTVRSVDELEAESAGYLAFKNTVSRLAAQVQKRNAG